MKKRSFNLETIILIIAIISLAFMRKFGLIGDGLTRFNNLSILLNDGALPETEYSLLGPLFSAPLWYLGKIFKTPNWWCARFNYIIVILGLISLYKILKENIKWSILRKFFILFLFASIIPHSINNFYGEIFTSVLVAVGIASITVNHNFWGWLALIIGSANIPATLLGLFFIVLKICFEEKRYRYLLFFILSVAILLIESWIRRGNPFITGYENNHGAQTILPYSGLPGFSYPFFFGLLSILFSFGKGIFFYSPGLLLPINNRFVKNKVITRLHFSWLIFLIGMILLYAKWWSWYGGWYWGPRFFILSSIPASFALAIHLDRPKASILFQFFLLIILTWSFWVGLNGMVFRQINLDICTQNNYALEFLCWYTPEFSALFRPFVKMKTLGGRDIFPIILFSLFYIVLAVPIYKFLIVKSFVIVKNNIKYALRCWKF